MGRFVVTAAWIWNAVDMLDIIANNNALSLVMVRQMDIFPSRGPQSSERAGAIKALVAAELDLGEDATVLVSELACMEEGCPPIETVIAVFRPAMEKMQFRLHCSMAEITEGDIHKMCARQINSHSEKNHGSCCS